MSSEFDVVVVGGGVNGAVTAALLARHGGLPAHRVALLAPDAGTLDANVGEAPISADAPPDLRVVALSRASERVLIQAGTWSHLPGARLCAYERMRVWHESDPPDGVDALVFDAAELAEPNLGTIAETRALTQAALQACREAGVQLIAAPLESFSVQAEGARLVLGGSGAAHYGELHARLVVGADGVRSMVRRQLGVDAGEHDYRQRALVATIDTARPHQRCAYQRFVAGGTLALLPLFNGQSSIVWSLPEARAEQLRTMASEDFERELGRASDRVLGAVRLVSARATFALQRLTARRLVGPRIALIGDAAHVVHPLAGQGLNLGLLDAAAVCESVAVALGEREDIGALRALRRYEQQRLSHDVLMSLSMSGFQKLFARGGLVGWLGARAMGLAGTNATLRRQFARHALGVAGDLPRLASRSF